MAGYGRPDSIELTVGNQVPQAADYYSYSKDTGVIIIESNLVTAPLNITAAGVAGGTSESDPDIPGSGDADPSDPGSSPDPNPGSGNAGTGGGIAGGRHRPYHAYYLEAGQQTRHQAGDRRGASVY